METQTPDTQSLLERVEKLEKDARFRAVRLRSHGFVIATIMLLIVSYVLLPRLSERRHPKTISTRNLVVEDQEGNLRGFLGVFHDGEPHLTLNDDEGNPRVVLDVSEKGDGRLSIYDAKGKLVDTVPGSGEYILGIEDKPSDDQTIEGE
jgi:hypothetical protein